MKEIEKIESQFKATPPLNRRTHIPKPYIPSCKNHHKDLYFIKNNESLKRS